MTLNRGTLVLLAFVAAVFFFVLAAFTVTLDDVPLVPAGLTALASGFLLERLP